MVVNCAESVPGAECSTRRNRISDQQRAPRAAQQRSWIPNQHGCAWERAVSAGGMPQANLFFEVKNCKRISAFLNTYARYFNSYVAVYAYFYVCVYVYIYTHVNIYRGIYVYMYICKCIYIYIYTYRYRYIFIYVHIYLYIYKGKMDKGEMVVNCAEPVPGAVCSTRRSRISDQQRAPRAVQQRSWIPNQHGCAWERAVSSGGMAPYEYMHTCTRTHILR